MNEEDKKRAYLNDWVKKKSKCKVNILANDYPNCGCESASSVPNGHGPVENSELLRYFITSRSIVDLKRKKDRTAVIFKRIFENGMSTVRLKYADRNEINFTANELYQSQLKNDPVYGGIVGVFDFFVKTVRFDHNNDQICCVLETPLENKISHADIVSSSGFLDKAEQNRMRQLLFEKIGKKPALKDIFEVDGGKLASYAPKFLTEKMSK